MARWQRFLRPLDPIPTLTGHELIGRAWRDDPRHRRNLPLRTGDSKVTVTVHNLNPIEVERIGCIDAGGSNHDDAEIARTVGVSGARHAGIASAAVARVRAVGVDGLGRAYATAARLPRPGPGLAKLRFD